MPPNLTLSHLRRALARALAHPDNPALARLPESERTVEGLARAYMPRNICIDSFTGGMGLMAPRWHKVTAIMRAWLPAAKSTHLLDLTDPGTCHAALVALALALGLDPGPAGLCAAWRPLYATTRAARRRVGWWLSCDDDAVYFLATALAPGDDDEIVSDAIASEPDPIKALAAALLHTVETPDAR